MTVHILGTGALAALYAQAWVAAGAEVVLLARNPEKAATLQAQGLWIEGQASPLPVSVATLDNLTLPIKLLWVCTKAYDAELALKQTLPHCTPNAAIVLVQNGMGFADSLIQENPNIQWYFAPTAYGAKRVASEKSDHTFALSQSGQIWLGPAKPSETKQPKWFSLLTATELNLSWENPIAPLLWKKLAINCAINPLTVLYRCPNGELLKHPKALNQMQAICDEIQSLLEHLNIDLNTDLFQTVCQVCRQTDTNTSSMLADVLAERPTEMPYLNAYIVKMCENLGLPCPINRHMMSLL